MNREVIRPEREEIAREINRAMERFPLILENLEEISRVVIPLPGDHELRHGCGRALTAILAELVKIQPAHPSKAVWGHEEQIAHSWLLGEMPLRLIDPAHLARLALFIDWLLPVLKDE